MPNTTTTASDAYHSTGARLPAVRPPPVAAARLTFFACDALPIAGANPTAWVRILRCRAVVADEAIVPPPRARTAVRGRRRRWAPRRASARGVTTTTTAG